MRPLFLHPTSAFSHFIFLPPVFFDFRVSHGSTLCIFSFMGFMWVSRCVLAPLALVEGDTTVSLHRHITASLIGGGPLETSDTRTSGVINYFPGSLFHSLFLTLLQCFLIIVSRLTFAIKTRNYPYLAH